MDGMNIDASYEIRMIHSSDEEMAGKFRQQFLECIDAIEGQTHLLSCSYLIIRRYDKFEVMISADYPYDTPKYRKHVIQSFRDIVEIACMNFGVACSLNS